MTRRIGFLGFDGVQALDLFGPADAFASDAFHRLASDARTDVPPNPYQVVVVGLAGKSFRTSSGILVRTDIVASTTRPLRLDTLVVPGGSGLRRAGVAERAAGVRGAQLAAPRLTATLLAGFATLALALTATGLAGGADRLRRNGA